MTARVLLFVGEIKGHPEFWWWDWHVEGVDPRDWTQAEMSELACWAWWLLVEQNRERDENEKHVSFTFTREGLCCNLKRTCITEGPYR